MLEYGDDCDEVFMEEEAVEFVPQSECNDSEEDIAVEEDAEESAPEDLTIEETPLMQQIWACALTSEELASGEYDAELHWIWSNVDAIAVLACGCPRSEGMPDGFHTTKSLAPTLPWTDHWWVGPMEEAAARVKAQPQGLRCNGTWHHLRVVEANVFSLRDGRALVLVEALDPL